MNKRESVKKIAEYIILWNEHKDGNYLIKAEYILDEYAKREIQAERDRIRKDFDRMFGKS